MKPSKVALVPAERGPDKAVTRVWKLGRRAWKQEGRERGGAERME